MTRVLSELLGAPELAFRQAVDSLERASGHPNLDISLTAGIERLTHEKLRELGLDPRDTTGEELYRTLHERIKTDDARLVATLRSKFGNETEDDNPSALIARALEKLPVPNQVFAIKTSVAKRLFLKFPPKRTAKQLGYRSIESMLKHEPIANLYAGARLVEATTWNRHLLQEYRHLGPADFEVRPLQVLVPESKRWRGLVADVISRNKHTVISLKEFGAIVLLPIPEQAPPVATITTLLLALNGLNELRSASTYLKLCQVKPDFGKTVQATAAGDPYLSASLLDRPVPWQIVQRYFARFQRAFKAELFGPHIEARDLNWVPIERALSHIDSTLDFWHDTSCISLLHDKQPVSLNVIDVALSCCNNLPFEHRIVHYFRHSLWHELLIGYMKHDAVEQSVLNQLQAELVAEPEST